MKKWGFLAVTAVVLATITACGSSKTAAKETDGGKETVVVGTSGVSNPFSYKKDGELTGYDVEVVKAIFKNLPDYKVKFETTEFESILSGVDNGRYQLGINNISENAERKEKYTFSLPIVENPNVFVVRKDDTKLKSLADLGGYKAVTEVGNSGATILNSYNAKHADDKVNIAYTEEDFVKQFEEIESGKYDVRIISKVSAETAIKEHGFDDLKIVSFDDPDSDAGAYILLAKQPDEKLLTAVNEQITELAADGTLSKISKEQLGDDFAPTADAIKEASK